MKYSEFKKLMEDKGFYVDNNIYDVLVYDKDELTVSSVSKTETLSLRTDYVYFKKLDEDLRRYIAQVTMELACTELKDREEEEKYYYSLKGFDTLVDKYLTHGKISHSFYLVSQYEKEDYNTQFTDKEFEALPDDIKSHHWEKIKVESED